MNILAFDTTTPACSVALYANDSIYYRFEIAGNRHTQLILPMIESVLNEACISRNDLSAIAFTQGPGSFTGIRITAAIAQGLCFALQIPAIAISTLQVVAQRALQELNQSHVIVAMDARMGEVYTGAYAIKDKLMVSVNQEQVILPGMLEVPPGSCWFGVGNAWDIYQKDLKLTQSKVSDCVSLLPHAKSMLSIAITAFNNRDWIKSQAITPVYLRNNIVSQKKNLI